MSVYLTPEIKPRPAAQPGEVYLIASGDLRLSANQTCWPAQASMEQQIIEAFAREALTVKRAHVFNPAEGHGFISNQRMGMEVFQGIPREAPLVVAVAVWQYSYHILAGLRDHRGPILTIANWSGEWPGLVGMLNLNGCLTKMGIPFSTIWSEDFQDEYFLKGIRQWKDEGCIHHDTSHRRDLDIHALPADEVELGENLARQLRDQHAILGIFDEGCMGMYNALIEDELLNACGIYKERLSQSALLAEMGRVTDEEAGSARKWLDERGMRFMFGANEATDLTESQVHQQMKMYIAAMRMADAFGCDAIGIQYQQGLKDMAPASDLPEGLFNNVERPPVTALDGSRVLYPGKALPHFNEVDEGSAVDALVTNRVWSWMGLDPATTLHDIRWGEQVREGEIDDFVWVFEISGAIPPSHLEKGYAEAVSERQPPMYFPKGGGTIKGQSKPGEIVWSRVYIQEGALHADLGRGTVVRLSEGEMLHRWVSTTPQWPVMNAILHGVTRDQLMASHKANHIQVAYAPDGAIADKALAVKAAMFAELGLRVHLCGDLNLI